MNKRMTEFMNKLTYNLVSIEASQQNKDRQTDRQARQTVPNSSNRKFLFIYNTP